MSSQKQIVDVPSGSLFYANGYVYYNIESIYDPSVKYTKNKRLCIGRSIDRKTMYANSNYLTLFAKDSLPEAPDRADALSIGMPLMFKWTMSECGLDDALISSFNEADARLIIDLASYTLIEQTDAFQHFPAYFFHNAILSDNGISDSTISRFLREIAKPSATEHFLDEWAEKNAGVGRAFICYDSTNINCVADGVSLAEMGHAKDDPSKPQVNLEYVVRQEDGLPLIYRDYPGSIVDVTQCSDMIDLIHELGYQDVVAICDRGYISRDNILAFDNAGVGFLMLLKSCDDTDALILKYGKKIKQKSSAYLDGYDMYGMTVRHRLFGNTGSCRYFHIIWSEEAASKGRRRIMKTVAEIEKSLAKMQKNGTHLSTQKEKEFGRYFNISIAPRTRKIKSYERNNAAIDEMVEAEGFHVLVSSDEMTCTEAIDAYSKRDCVEKSFRALKTNTGMDALRGHSNLADDGRFFILFIASILRAVIFHRTQKLRVNDRKNFTFSAIVKELNKIEAVVNYKTGTYSRRYKLTARQKSVLACVGLTESDADDFIATI